MYNTEYIESLEGQGIKNFTFKQDDLVNVPIKCQYLKHSLIQVKLPYQLFLLLWQNKFPVETSNNILTAS